MDLKRKRKEREFKFQINRFFFFLGKYSLHTFLLLEETEIPPEDSIWQPSLSMSPSPLQTPFHIKKPIFYKDFRNSFEVDLHFLTHNRETNFQKWTGREVSPSNPQDPWYFLSQSLLYSFSYFLPSGCPNLPLQFSKKQTLSSTKPPL